MVGVSAEDGGVWKACWLTADGPASDSEPDPWLWVRGPGSVLRFETAREVRPENLS